jgi:hypothetical protein
LAVVDRNFLRLRCGELDMILMMLDTFYSSGIDAKYFHMTSIDGMLFHLGNEIPSSPFHALLCSQKYILTMNS